MKKKKRVMDKNAVAPVVVVKKAGQAPVTISAIRKNIKKEITHHETEEITEGKDKEVLDLTDAEVNDLHDDEEEITEGRDKEVLNLTEDEVADLEDDEEDDEEESAEWADGEDEDENDDETTKLTVENVKKRVNKPFKAVAVDTEEDDEDEDDEEEDEEEEIEETKSERLKRLKQSFNKTYYEDEDDEDGIILKKKKEVKKIKTISKAKIVPEPISKNEDIKKVKKPIDKVKKEIKKPKKKKYNKEATVGYKDRIKKYTTYIDIDNFDALEALRADGKIKSIASAINEALKLYFPTIEE